MFYPWGRKDPFIFATSTIYNGKYYGKYPVKIYNYKSELIYQVDDGADNTEMTPTGGVLIQNRNASSMMETIKNPNVFYYLINYAPISQVGHNKQLWNYYWTSHSRGMDGIGNYYNPNQKWHNTYLDGYIVLRTKSIYDPCPYGYRTPTNGTYNDFNVNPGWGAFSYIGGVKYFTSWFSGNGSKLNVYVDVLWYLDRRTSSSYNNFNSYLVTQTCSQHISLNRVMPQNYGFPLRCIEDATGKSIFLLNNFRQRLVFFD